MTHFPLQIAGQTDVGQHRTDNQDAFITKPLWADNDALLVVIDGVGGYAGGAEAAAIAKESIVQYMAAPTGDALTMLQEAVVHANNQIVTHKYNRPELARMCCVLTAAVADTELRKLLFVHVGDTRLYRFREGTLTKLTHDHSLVGVREDANQLTEREAMKHPRRNEILRDVGTLPHRVDDPEFLESGETDFRPGDRLLLCSDGLTAMLTRDQVTAVLGQAMLPEDQTNELIRQANEQGGHDNITVVVAHFPAKVGTTLATPILPTETGYVETAQPAPMLVKQVAGWAVAPAAIPKAASPGKGLFVLMGVIVVLLVAGIAWWQTDPPKPVPVRVRRDSVRAVSADSGRAEAGDTLIDLTIKNKPDSLKKP
jgi:PPM family protein phosphatase